MKEKIEYVWNYRLYRAFAGTGCCVARLHQLEYRGYDSAGMALLTDEGEIYLRKKVGQVDALEAEGCDYIVCLGHLGIDDESAGNRSVDLLAEVSGIQISID